MICERPSLRTQAACLRVLIMNSQSRARLFFGLVCFLFVSPLLSEQVEAEKVLTVEEAKFQMMQLYLASKVPTRNLSTKYPELRKADKAARDAGRVLREALQEHPQLKARFTEIELMEVSIPEKMKLWQPLYAEAQSIADLQEVHANYDALRVQALRVELETLKAEGFEELAQKMEVILSQVGQPASKKKEK